MEVRLVRRCLLAGALSSAAVLLGTVSLANEDRASPDPWGTSGFLTGQEWLELKGGERALYVTGLVDGLLVAPVFGASSEGKESDLLDKVVKCAQGKNAIDLELLIRDYLTDGPGQSLRHLKISISVVGALADISCRSRDRHGD